MLQYVTANIRHCFSPSKYSSICHSFEVSIALLMIHILYLQFEIIANMPIANPTHASVRFLPHEN